MSHTTPDTYQTITTAVEGLYKEKGSKFFAYAYPVDSEETVNDWLNELKSQHPKARHHCYAYRIGTDGNTFRANDDGEPSGTAGRPILGQIDSFEVTNTLVVVVRYFGGTKLGASGLITAYKAATQEALKEATIEEKLIRQVYEFSFEYAIMSDVMNALKKHQPDILSQDFTDKGVIKVAIRLSEVAQKMTALKADIAHVYLEEVPTLKTIEGLDIKDLGIM